MKKLFSLLLTFAIIFSSFGSFSVSAATTARIPHIIYKTHSAHFYSSLQEDSESPQEDNQKPDNIQENILSATHAIGKACLNAESEVNLSSFSITEEQFCTIIDQVLFTEYPEISDVLEYHYTMFSDNKMIQSVHFEYSYSPSVVKARIAQQNQIVNALISRMGSNLSDLQKVKIVHDYLVANVAYDFDHEDRESLPHDSFSAYGAFFNRVAVCQGYSQAFQLFMNRLNIHCITVISDEMDHAWNMVQIDQNWYHVDTTWDDPIPDKPYFVDYFTFLVSDSALSDENRQHTDWEKDAPKATDTQFDEYDWRKFYCPEIMDSSQLSLDTKAYTGNAGNFYGFLAKGFLDRNTLTVTSSNPEIADVIIANMNDPRGCLYTLRMHKAGTTTILVTSSNGGIAHFNVTVQGKKNIA